MRLSALIVILDDAVSGAEADWRWTITRHPSRPLDIREAKERYRAIVGVRELLLRELRVL